MGNYKNRIITLSRDSASGKGSVVRELKNLYEMSKLKVQIISVEEVFQKVAIRAYKRKFPEIKNPTIEEIKSNPSFTEELKNIDECIAEEITKIGEKINSEYRENEVFIIDVGYGGCYIKGTFNVRLTADSKRDTNNSKLVIGTILASVQDIAMTIKICEELELQGKEFAKTWASPELFYPTQPIRDTMSCGYRKDQLTVRELAELIRKNGIYPDDPVWSKTITDSEYQYVCDGQHRTSASIIAGITLIPYKAIGNVEKATVPSMMALSNIYDYEDLITKPDGSSFRFAKYPKIDERSEEHDLIY